MAARTTVSPNRRRYRSIPARSARFFVPWDLTSVQAFIESQDITAADFSSRAPGLHRLIRDLLILAAQEFLSGGPSGRVQRLVRELVELRHA